MPRTPNAGEPDPAEVAEAKAREDALAATAAEEAAAAFKPPVETDEAAAALTEAEEALLARAKAMRASYPDLSNEEILEALKEARADVEEKRKQAMIKRIMADERARLRREEGLTVGSAVLDEIVKVEIDIASWQNPIRMNFMEYHHGYTYDVPRHVANQIAEMAQWGRRLQRELDGKDSLTEFYKKKTGTNISPIRGVERAA